MITYSFALHFVIDSADINYYKYYFGTYNQPMIHNQPLMHNQHVHYNPHDQYLRNI